MTIALTLTALSIAIVFVAIIWCIKLKSKFDLRLDVEKRQAFVRGVESMRTSFPPIKFEGGKKNVAEAFGLTTARGELLEDFVREQYVYHMNRQGNADLVVSEIIDSTYTVNEKMCMLLCWSYYNKILFTNGRELAEDKRDLMTEIAEAGDNGFSVIADLAEHQAAITNPELSEVVKSSIALAKALRGTHLETISIPADCQDVEAYTAKHLDEQGITDPTQRKLIIEAIKKKFDSTKAILKDVGLDAVKAADTPVEQPTDSMIAN